MSEKKALFGIRAECWVKLAGIDTAIQSTASFIPYICPNCDNTHLQITCDVTGETMFSVVLSPEGAEKLGQHLINPQPVNPADCGTFKG